MMIFSYWVFFFWWGNRNEGHRARVISLYTGEDFLYMWVLYAGLSEIGILLIGSSESKGHDSCLNYSGVIRSNSSQLSFVALRGEC